MPLIPAPGGGDSSDMAERGIYKVGGDRSSVQSEAAGSLRMQSEEVVWDRIALLSEHW